MKATKTTKTDPAIHKKSMTRRRFLGRTALASSALTILPRHVLGRGFLAPSDKITLGLIGLGRQGQGLARRFISETQAEIVAGSDVWTTKMDAFSNYVSAQYAENRPDTNHGGIKTYRDYSELLDDPTIDGVIVATPDHWHAIQAMQALRAGKDVYCEKPLTHRISEGIDLVNTVKQTDKILQTGSMQRSRENFRRACELVRNGYIGEVNKILVNVGDPAVAYNLHEEPMPKEVDWNQWCGPAPMLAYNHRLAPSSNEIDFWPQWRDFKETGGGILCDWGAHMFDIVQWALDMDRSGPIRYVPPKDSKAVRGLRMFYENGIEMVHEDFGRGWGVRFLGSEGTLDISRQYLETDPPSILTAELKDSDERLYNSQENHYQDWLDAIRNHTQPLCDVETGHRSASICNIANIAYQLGRPLNWDPEEQHFMGDAEANALRTRDNREF